MMYLTTSTAIASAVALLFLRMPAAASWPYAVLSGFLHLGYGVFLVRTYRVGDLGQTYPIARGSSPLLVTIGATLVAGERLNPLLLLGVVLVSCGIMSLALKGLCFAIASIPSALITGCFIAAYTVTDGMGVRISANSFAYTALMFLLWGLLTLVAFVAIRGWANPWGSWADGKKAAVGGIVSILAYGIVIWAMQLGTMGAVSALRETSVLFAALLGRVFLNEKLTPRRLAACAVIVCGAVCLGYGR
jgi:drug/metabolite transporter (DMT)-like permease